jgi:alpha-1,6-mannosyltransferase
VRVVDVTSFFSESCGGIKTYYREKARHLPALGVECHFVVPGRRRSDEALEQGTLHRLPGPPLPGNAQYRLFGRLSALVELVSRLRPDVIEIGSHYRLPGVARRLLARLAALHDGAGPRLVGFFHSDIARTLVEPLVRPLPRRLAGGLLDAVWRWVRRQHQHYDLTLVASRTVAAELRARGLPRVRWVGLGVDTDVFRPQAPRRYASAVMGTLGGSPNPPAMVRAGQSPAAPHAPVPTLVYAGRLSADKDLGTLLAAADEIHRATAAELHLIGEGPWRARLERFAAARRYLRVEPHLASRAALAARLAAADAVITPGARETFSLTTAEALACATPVLAPDSGGAGELVTASGGGLCFPAGDAAALARAAIDLLWRPPSARAELGARGRAHILGGYTWPAVMRRMLAAYQAPRGELAAATAAGAEG